MVLDEPSCDFSEVIAPGERKIVKKVLARWAVGRTDLFFVYKEFAVAISFAKFDPVTVVFVALWLHTEDAREGC